MKLFTEEQVREMLFDLGDVLFNNNQNGIEDGEPAKYFDEIINEQNHIEIPSDEEIYEQAKTQSTFAPSFIYGAEWMRDKILK